MFWNQAVKRWNVTVKFCKTMFCVHKCCVSLVLTAILIANQKKIYQISSELQKSKFSTIYVLNNLLQKIIMYLHFYQKVFQENINGAFIVTLIDITITTNSNMFTPYLNRIID